MKKLIKNIQEYFYYTDWAMVVLWAFLVPVMVLALALVVLLFLVVTM